MRVRITHNHRIDLGGKTAAPGETVTVRQELGEQLIARGWAESETGDKAGDMLTGEPPTDADEAEGEATD